MGKLGHQEEKPGSAPKVASVYLLFFLNDALFILQTLRSIVGLTNYRTMRDGQNIRWACSDGQTTNHAPMIEQRRRQDFGSGGF